MPRHRNDPNARQHLMRLITCDEVSDQRSPIGVVCMDPDAGAKALRLGDSYGVIYSLKYAFQG